MKHATTTYCLLLINWVIQYVAQLYSVTRQYKGKGSITNRSLDFPSLLQFKMNIQMSLNHIIQHLTSASPSPLIHTHKPRSLMQRHHQLRSCTKKIWQKTEMQMNMVISYTYCPSASKSNFPAGTAYLQLQGLTTYTSLKSTTIRCNSHLTFYGALKLIKRKTP